MSATQPTKAEANAALTRLSDALDSEMKNVLDVLILRTFIEGSDSGNIRLHTVERINKDITRMKTSSGWLYTTTSN